MPRRRLDVLEPYEVIGQPVVSSTGLSYRPWIDEAVAPYGATRLPVGSTGALRDALQRAGVVPGLAPPAVS
jgi:hypothetical protein